MEVVNSWRSGLEWERKDFHDLFQIIPEEEIYKINTTTQAHMNVSSGKMEMQRYAARSELDRSIDM